jgi:hypothetical protein
MMRKIIAAPLPMMGKSLQRYFACDGKIIAAPLPMIRK